MSKETLDDHQKKLEKFKKAIKNNIFSIDSSCIAEALLEAQKHARKNLKNVEEPEIA